MTEKLQKISEKDNPLFPIFIFTRSSNIHFVQYLVSHTKNVKFHLYRDNRGQVRQNNRGQSGRQDNRGQFGRQTNMGTAGRPINPWAQGQGNSFYCGKNSWEEGTLDSKLLNKINISFVGLKYLGIFLKSYFSWFYNFFFV